MAVKLKPTCKSTLTKLSNNVKYSTTVRILPAMNFKTEEKINLRELCRSCLGQNLININIFETVDHEYKLKLCEIYRECANLNVQENDGMPPNICYECLEEMRVAYRFLRQSHASEVRLRRFMVRNDLIAKDKQDGTFNFGELVFLGEYIKEEKIESSVTEPIEENLKEDNSIESESNSAAGSESGLTDDTTNPIVVVYMCNTCNERFENADEYQQHKCQQSSCTRFLCSVCGKYFKTLRNLESHSITHSGVRKHKCNLCDKAFNREDILRSHQRVHTGEKPYECKVCGKKFAQSNTLKTHTALHTGKTIECRICNKMFSRPSMLTVHNREHTGEKPYVCDQCPKRFFQQCHLSAHKLSHLDHKQFKCEICGKEYTQKSTLTLHMYNHTGKRFKCVKCSTGFNKKDRFRSHLMVHHGIEWNGASHELIDLELEQSKIRETV